MPLTDLCKGRSSPRTRREQSIRRQPAPSGCCAGCGPCAAVGTPQTTGQEGERHRVTLQFAHFAYIMALVRCQACTGPTCLGQGLGWAGGLWHMPACPLLFCSQGPAWALPPVPTPCTQACPGWECQAGRGGTWTNTHPVPVGADLFHLEAFCAAALGHLPVHLGHKRQVTWRGGEGLAGKASTAAAPAHLGQAAGKGAEQPSTGPHFSCVPKGCPCNNLAE